MCMASEMISKKIKDLQKEDISSINSDQSSSSQSSAKQSRTSLRTINFIFGVAIKPMAREHVGHSTKSVKSLKKGPFHSRLFSKSEKSSIINESDDEEEELFVDAIFTTVKNCFE